MGALFTPVSIVSGLIAGMLSRKAFDAIWGVVSDEEAPKPKHREIVFSQLVVALIIEGAVARLIRGLVDHGGRHGFAQLTGQWPGEERPDPE